MPQGVDFTIRFIPREVYKYLFLARQFVFVLLDGRDEKELRNTSMPEAHPRLLNVAEKVMTPGVWEGCF
jgi:hypothetical protein